MSSPGLISTTQQISGATDVAAATTIAAIFTSDDINVHPGATPAGGAALTHGFEPRGRRGAVAREFRGTAPTRRRLPLTLKFTFGIGRGATQPRLEA